MDRLHRFDRLCHEAERAPSGQSQVGSRTTKNRPNFFRREIVNKLYWEVTLQRWDPYG